MTFWLKTPDSIYKNWLNSHFDRIMFTVSKLEIKKFKIVLEHPVYIDVWKGCSPFKPPDSGVSRYRLGAKPLVLYITLAALPIAISGCVAIGDWKGSTRSKLTDCHVINLLTNFK